MATEEQQPIDDVELQHQSEEPVGSRPDDAVGSGQEIVEHSHLRHDIHQLVGVGSGRDGIEHREGHEADDHHAEEFEEMEAHEGRGTCVPGLRIVIPSLRPLIFHRQSIGAQKEEYRHAIVAEEGDQMHGKPCVGASQCMAQSLHMASEELVLVLFHRRAKPMAVVVEEDAEDRQAP